ncbi:hypothetical protein V5799_015789 [Amblyomma americanum]|uniref:Peptidase M12B domain-containing protein n=1 Tax=Amblyomma americanum TaxID=6943 RepID=A0AAQ4F6U7_AMBAM
MLESLGLACVLCVVYFSPLLSTCLGAYNEYGLYALPEHAAVVYPQLFDVRDDLGTRVLRVNDKITLNLKKSAVLPDDFVLVEEREGVPQHTYINLRYLTVSRPKIQLIFRSVQITTSRKETYFKRVWENQKVIDGLKSLYNLVDFVEEKKKRYEMYDIVFFITGLDMAAVQDSRVEQSLQGYAFVGSVCLKTRVGLGEDVADTYIGIRIIAHEIGHTLGCSHDGTSVQGHIPKFTADSNRCPWEQGYLMSYIEENSNSMKFSSCCDYSMSLVAWSSQIKCLHQMNSSTR